MSAGYRTRTINESSPFETIAYRADADRDGPTAVVVGGQHGNEPEGWEAAERLLEGWLPAAGTLVVISRLDPTAIAIGRYSGGDLPTDMNSLWPTGREPAHEPIRQLWQTIAEVEPDVVIDLHSSGGIYGEAGSGVGQAIFPTPNSYSIASRVCNRLNSEHIAGSGLPEEFQYRRGNVLSGSGTKLARKVHQDLGVRAFICEPAKVSPSSFEQRREWNLWSAIWLLEECGVDVVER